MPNVDPAEDFSCSDIKQMNEIVVSKRAIDYLIELKDTLFTSK
jgi:hypothetical protein